MGDEWTPQRQVRRTAACFVGSLAIVLAVFTFNRHAVRKGSTAWTNDVLWVAASPGRVIFGLVLAGALTWAISRLLVRR